jgi:hypothetical protein
MSVSESLDIAFSGLETLLLLPVVHPLQFLALLTKQELESLMQCPGAGHGGEVETEYRGSKGHERIDLPA